MQYFYILKSSKTGELYYGQTNNLKKRLKQQNDGRNESTKPYTPWGLVYYEAYQSKLLAENREKQIKYFGRTWSALVRRLGL